MHTEIRSSPLSCLSTALHRCIFSTYPSIVQFIFIFYCRLLYFRHNEGRISNQTSQNLLLLGGCCRHLLACNFGNIPNKKHREVNAYNAVEGLGRIGSVALGRLESNKKTMMADTGAVFCSPVWWWPASQIFGNKMQI